MAEKTKILLYYKYVPLQNPEELKTWQKELCQRLNLKGRILISSEGLNGTVAGTPAEIDAYMQETSKRVEFADMEWKISWAEEQVFPKLKVLVRDEIVTLGVIKTGQDVSLDKKGDYIEPEELLELYEKNKDFIIIDARNNYEAKIGKFKNALTPDIRNFREFPAFVEQISDYKNKTVVTYCTGGVRCEKASAYMREQGFKNVRQLHGGIHEYGEKARGKHFEGEMFVFDKRLHIPVNSENPQAIAQCLFCQTPISRYIDCTRIGCPELFICCENCESTYDATCSTECMHTKKMKK